MPKRIYYQSASCFPFLAHICPFVMSTVHMFPPIRNHIISRQTSTCILPSCFMSLSKLSKIRHCTPIFVHMGFRSSHFIQIHCSHFGTYFREILQYLSDISQRSFETNYCSNWYNQYYKQPYFNLYLIKV